MKKTNQDAHNALGRAAQEREARISALLSTLAPLVQGGLRDDARRVFAAVRTLIARRSAAQINAMEQSRGLT